MERTKTYDDIPELLIQCRTERRLTLEDVGRALGISRQAVSRIEAGAARGRRTTRRRLQQFLRKHGYFPRDEQSAA